MSKLSVMMREAEKTNNYNAYEIGREGLEFFKKLKQYMENIVRIDDHAIQYVWPIVHEVPYLEVIVLDKYGESNHITMLLRNQGESINGLTIRYEFGDETYEDILNNDILNRASYNEIAQIILEMGCVLYRKQFSPVEIHRENGIEGYSISYTTLNEDDVAVKKYLNKRFRGVELCEAAHYVTIFNKMYWSGNLDIDTIGKSKDWVKVRLEA